MQRRDGTAGAPGMPRARLLGWFVAVNSLAVLAAVAGAGSATAEAAHQFAVWCGIR